MMKWLKNMLEWELMKFLKDYVIGDALKTGEYYSVMEATSKLDSEIYAIKMINKLNIGDDNKVKKIRKEIDIMKSVEHLNILRLFQYFENEEKIISICEYVPGHTELFDCIVKKGSYREAEAINIVLQILDAVSYLHNRNIVHRDLKPENILCSISGEKEIIKIASFEISAIQSDEMRLFTSIGTPCYIAPEVILADGYDKEVDMWGIGIITFMLLAGFPPFCVEEGGDEAQVINTVLNLAYNFDDDIWLSISDEAKDFISNLLVKEPKKRLNVDNAKLHPWIQKYHAN